MAVLFWTGYYSEGNGNKGSNSLCIVAGPERARLSVKDDKKEINFDPKDLLTQIATIYVHLSRRDKAGLLAQAIVADKRSYYTNMFPDALKV